jgi:hypothetical protein
MKISLPSENTCAACSQGKLITKPSPSKVVKESPSFLERIQGEYVDLFIHHASLLNIFMVLTDVSNKWSHIYLLSSQNIAFARLIAQIIRLRAQFSDYSIKKI